MEQESQNNAISELEPVKQLILDYSVSMENLRYSFDELLLPDDAVIEIPEVIQSYGNRLNEIRNFKDPDNVAKRTGWDSSKPLSYAVLGEIVNLSQTAVQDIIKGKNQRINMEKCNIFARSFQCSTWYILGICDEFNKTAADNALFRIPFLQYTKQETLMILEANLWATTDMELFHIFHQLYLVDRDTRERIKDSLKLMLK